MKATSRNTGVHGASNIAAMTGVAIVVRIESKSRIACAAAAESVAIIWLQDLRREQGVEPLAGADQQPVADHVERRQRQQRQRQRQRDEQQGGLAAGRDDAVVDLQHVQGRREIEDVDQQAEAPRPR